MIKKAVSIILTAAICVASFTACGSKVDEFVTIDNVNQSSVNVAEGFFQAIFTGDEELFVACYPDTFKLYENDEGQTVDMSEVFEQYTTIIDPTYTYTGASLSGYNDYSEELGYDFPGIQNDIAVLHHTTPEAVLEAQIVKLRLNFDVEDGTRVTTDVYILVYKTETAGYVFELQNSDAEFAV